MNSIILIIVVIVIIGIINIIMNNKKMEGFDLDVGLVHHPYVGKFDDCYQIGTRKNFSHTMCKNLCNHMDSCSGISYRGHPNYECRLYNDTSLLKYDPRYVSWFNFWNKMY